MLVLVLPKHKFATDVVVPIHNRRGRRFRPFLPSPKFPTNTYNGTGVDPCGWQKDTLSEAKICVGEKDSHAIPKSFLFLATEQRFLVVVSYLLFSSNKDENSCLTMVLFNLMGSLIFVGGKSQ